jgi:aklavinone 12-hydroxylase
VWIDGRSTVDVPGHGFALMVTQDQDGWSRVAGETQRLLGVPVAVQPMDGAADWQGAALVRPDGVVAWRTVEAPAAAGLHTALAEILGRASTT